MSVYIIAGMAVLIVFGLIKKIWGLVKFTVIAGLIILALKYFHVI